VVFVMVGENQPLEISPRKEAQQPPKRCRGAAVQQQPIDEIGTRPVERPTQDAAGHPDVDDVLGDRLCT
jgi:hypothetical protein